MSTYRVIVEEYGPGQATNMTISSWDRKYLWNGQAESKEQALKEAAKSMKNRKQ